MNLDIRRPAVFLYGSTTQREGWILEAIANRSTRYWKEGMPDVLCKNLREYSTRKKETDTGRNPRIETVQSRNRSWGIWFVDKLVK